MGGTEQDLEGLGLEAFEGLGIWAPQRWSMHEDLMNSGWNLDDQGSGDKHSDVHTLQCATVCVYTYMHYTHIYTNKITDTEIDFNRNWQYVELKLLISRKLKHSNRHV